MPELPEVETTRRSLLPHLKGQRVARVQLRRKSLRFPIPEDFALRLEGRVIENIRRRAKYLLFDLDSGDVVLAHLGMSGSLRVIPPSQGEGKGGGATCGEDGIFPSTLRPPPNLPPTGGGTTWRAHDHVLWHLENGLVVVYHDPRRFGMMDMLARGEEKTHKLLKDMAPEPLSNAFSETYLKTALMARDAPIKTTIMDQKIVVGVGNIYASESLFLAGIHPATPARDAAVHSARLISCIQKTLRAAIASGGSTLRNYVGADGATGYFQHRFNVYNREDLPCVACASPIRHTVQAGRATYFCAQCQKQSSGQSKKRKKPTQKI